MVRIILFVCTQNAGRSQMAEAIFNKSAPRGWKAISAGIEPADRVYSVIIEAMKEVGIDLGRKKPQMLTNEMIVNAAKVFTVCDISDELCPAPMLRKVIRWEIEDPKDKPIEAVRAIRAKINKKVQELVRTLR